MSPEAPSRDGEGPESAPTARKRRRSEADRQQTRWERGLGVVVVLGLALGVSAGSLAVQRHNFVRVAWKFLAIETQLDYGLFQGDGGSVPYGGRLGEGRADAPGLGRIRVLGAVALLALVGAGMLLVASHFVPLRVAGEVRLAALIAHVVGVAAGVTFAASPLPWELARDVGWKMVGDRMVASLPAAEPGPALVVSGLALLPHLMLYLLARRAAARA